LFAPLPFAKRDMARAAPIALRQRARGSKFSRRPQRSCSVGAAKLVSHVCDEACSAVSRRAGLGWRRARMKFFAVIERAQVRYAHSHTPRLVPGVPSSETFFQYLSWKSTLASVVCRIT